ncbi:MAG: hypothetical protein HY096_02865, partial [Nitrospinae bacterium]|nr:hypothetical protein [Nitrospinota bacterium]
NINTPTAVAGVRGTDFFVFHDRGITGVIFKEGSGFVANPNMPDKIVNINAGQVTFVVSTNIPPSPPRPATNLELAVHTKDTTPAEKPKEEKKEDKPKEEKAKTVEAKAEDKKEEKEKKEQKKERGTKTAETKTEEKKGDEQKPKEGEPAPASSKQGAEGGEMAKTEEGAKTTETASGTVETKEAPAVESAPAAPVEVKADIPAADIGGMVTPADMITNPVFQMPVGGGDVSGFTGSVDTASMPAAITTAVSGTTVDALPVNLLPVTETHPNLLTDVTINVVFR